MQEKPDVIETLECIRRRTSGQERFFTLKLIAACGGDWEASVKQVPSSFFESREDYEELLLCTYEISTTRKYRHYAK
jgi:hypothetical protein